MASNNQTFFQQLDSGQSDMIKKLTRKIKLFVLYSDHFCNKTFLRCREGAQYQTYTGGICSMILIIVLAVVLTQSVINTFNKTVINFSVTKVQESDPSYFDTNTSPLLFAVGIDTLNLNDPLTKYFNIEISQRAKARGSSDVRTFFNLKACNRTQWTNFDQSLARPFDDIRLQNWLCLDQSVQLQFQGKFTSQMFKYVKISVKQCRILSGDNRTCMNSSAMTGTYTFNYYFVNTILNPGSENYVQTYLQDKNYFVFSKSKSISANIFISTFTITTDESLWPIKSQITQNGGMILNQAQQYINQGSQFVELFIRKSTQSLQVARSFRKYDDMLSYIGGLFGTILFLLFVMGKYDEYSFQIYIAQKIYRFAQGVNIKSRAFNLLSFFAYCGYCMVQLFKRPKWQIMNHFDDTRQQINKQLDIKLIMRKLAFFDDCMRYLLQDYEINCLHLKTKQTLTQAAVSRRKFQYRETFIKQRALKKKQIQENKRKMKQLFSFQVHPSRNHISYSENKKNQNIQQIDKKQLQKQSDLQSQNDLSDQESQQSFKSQHSETYENQIYEQLTINLKKLEQQALKGNNRCAKIYNSLDSYIKTLDPELIKEKESKYRDIQLEPQSHEH